MGDFYPEALWQRCVVHFYRNVFSYVPRGKMEEVSLMLKAIHASENKEAARAKAKEVIKKLKEMRLGSAARWGREVCGGDAYVLRVSVVTLAEGPD